MTSPLKKDNIIFSCSNDIKQICSPLYKYFDIANFTYIRIYPDMSRAHLDTNPHWAKTFYDNLEMYSKGFLAGGHHWESGFSPLFMLGGACIPDAIAHGLGEGIVISKHCDKYTELFYITHEWRKYQDTKLIQMINNMDLIECFIAYFISQADELIEESSKSPILCPFLTKDSKPHSFYIDHIDKKGFLSELNRSEYPLTNREYQCIYYTAMDMSSKNIARRLNISPKTVERHLENAKSKFGYRTKAALIKEISKIDIFSSYYQL